MKVDYTLGGLDADLEYKMAIDVTARGETRGVTNAARAPWRNVADADGLDVHGRAVRGEIEKGNWGSDSRSAMSSDMRSKEYSALVVAGCVAVMFIAVSGLAIYKLFTYCHHVIR